MRYLLTALTLFGLWLLMSGVYKPLVIGLGAASSLLAAYVVARMAQAADSDPIEVKINPVEMIKYFAWLLVEIGKSNLAVTKAIMGRRLKIKPHFFKAPYSQKTDLGQTAFANSITLTPGTITVEIEDGDFWVHAIEYENGTLNELADMDRRVTQVEWT